MKFIQKMIYRYILSKNTSKIVVIRFLTNLNDLREE